MEYVTAVSVALLLVLLRALYSKAACCYERGKSPHTYLTSYLKQPFSYWEKTGVPADPGMPLVGSMLQAFTVNFHEVELKRHLKYGKIYGHYENSRPVLNLTDPDLLRDVFVKDFQFFMNRRDFGGWDPLMGDMVNILKGEEWKRVRSVITPTFTTGKIKKMFFIIKDSAEQLCKNLTQMARNRKPVNARRIFGSFAMDVIANTAFATKLDSLNDPDNPFVAAARKAFTQDGIPWRAMMIFMLPGVMKFFGIPGFDPASTSFFKDLTLKIIDERRRSGKKQNDFLQLMLDSSEMANEGKLTPEDVEDEDKNLQDMGHEEENPKTFVKNARGLTDNQVVANSVIFFLAGYETTALTLSFATYSLALNPDCQEKLIAEIDESICQNKNQMTYEAINNMKYLDMVISETLRLYPPATRTDRVAGEDYKLGNTGIVIKKGHMVGVPIYAVHHDPEIYPDPEKFDPMRFSPEEKARRGAFTFVPFGAGPRNCVGMRFALIEMKICLAYFFSLYRVKRCQMTKVPLQFNPGQRILHPKEIIFELEERTDKIILS